MDRLELYKDMYKREVERRNELNNELSIPIGVISILATAAYFYISNLDKKHDIVSLIFDALLTVGLICLLISVYFLLKSYNIFTNTEAYLYSSFPTELETYYESYSKYLRDENVPEDEVKVRTDEVFRDYLLLNYVNNGTKNTSINDSRSTDLFRCKRSMAMSLIALLLAFIPFSINHFSQAEKIEKIEIVNKDSIPCKK